MLELSFSTVIPRDLRFKRYSSRLWRRRYEFTLPGGQSQAWGQGVEGERITQGVNQGASQLLLSEVYSHSWGKISYGRILQRLCLLNLYQLFLLSSDHFSNADLETLQHGSCYTRKCSAQLQTPKGKGDPTCPLCTKSKGLLDFFARGPGTSWKQYRQFTLVSLKGIFFSPEWKNETLIRIRKAESSCLISLSENIKILKWESLGYWGEFSHLWGRGQENSMRNQWNGATRRRKGKSLTIAKNRFKTGEEILWMTVWPSRNTELLWNKRNVSSQASRSCGMRQPRPACALWRVRCLDPHDFISFCSSDLQFFLELQYWFTSTSHTVPSCTTAF